MKTLTDIENMIASTELFEWYEMTKNRTRKCTLSHGGLCTETTLYNGF